MRSKLLAIGVSLALACSFSASVSAGWFSKDKEVNTYQKKAIDSRYNEAVDAPELCKVLPKDACSLLLKLPDFEIDAPLMDADDRVIIGELLSLSPQDIDKASKEDIPQARLAILRASATTLGVQAGIAMESARFNRIITKYESFYDKAVNFEALMIQNGSGRNIVPAVVQVIQDSRNVGAGGRVFRYADVVYRITAQPRFAIEPPNWRGYLKLKIVKPEMPLAALLPATSKEADYWKIHLVRGYMQGIDTTRFRVSAKFRQMTTDYVGMVTYNLLLSYKMITPPTVEVTHSPVVATESGSVMAVDDTIAVLSVEPVFNTARRTWEAYPQIKKLEAIQREYQEFFERVKL